jgi:DNA repair protein RecN (Recombination protein N)
MIRELRIRGLGVIDEAVVTFAEGFTVVTGETGAGKTMVLTGLSLIMGHKADSGVVRAGAERADVDGEWLLSSDDHAQVASRLDEAGARIEESGDEFVLLLARSVAAEGRSRAFAGGRSVPAVALGEITEGLIAVHGQADQLLIRDPRRQRELLDRFAGGDLIARLGGYREAREAWRDSRRELDELVSRRQEREREAALLRHGIDEIAAVNPASGEDEHLKAQANVLAHAGDLVAEVGAALALMVGGDDARDQAPNVAELLAQARRAVEHAASLDPSLGSMLMRLDDAGLGITEAARELAAYARGVEADPTLQEAVEERRRQITALMRRYGPGLDDVLAWWAAAERSVAEVDGAQERIDALAGQAAALREDVLSAAAGISAARRSAATRFATDVTAELTALAMPDAEIEIDVASAGEPEQFGPDGADTVSMLLRPHAGSDVRPLGKGASGGELSRIMLAIEVVLAEVNSVPTFVFDEVDAGIGGKVAVEVGRRLARLARGAQVIVVTHLPQVAAFADHHVVVTKEGDGRVTSASVVAVEGSDRVHELVRMLSGLEGSQSGAEHAAELLALADRDRK